MNTRRINTNYWQKPIPFRFFDWAATYDGDEPNELGGMDVGFGQTEAEAIADLIDNYPRDMVAPSTEARIETTGARIETKCENS